MNKYFTLILLTMFTIKGTLAQTWENTNCTGSDVVYDLSVSSAKLLVARGNSGILTSTDGSSWTTSNVGATGSFRSIKTFGNTSYTAINASNIYASTNNGSSWNLLGGAAGLASVYMTTVFKNENVMLYSTSNGSASVYYSTDEGSTWSVSQFDYGSGLQSGFESGQKNIIELDGALYFSSLKDVFKSIDNGATWNVITTAPNIPDGTVTSLCATDDALILTIYGYGTHKSTDGGLTWTMIMGGGFGALTNNMTISYYYNGYLFVGGAMGMVYVSEDGGTNWTDISLGGFEIVQCFQYFNGHIYAGTNSNLHRYAYNIATVSIQEEEKLLSIFPNPTTDQLIISGIENYSQNIIKILSIDGRLVKQALMTSNIIHVGELPAGVYVLQIEGVATAHRFIKE